MRPLRLIEDDKVSASNRIVAERLAEHRQTIAQLEATRRSLERQLVKGMQRIDDALVERFCHPQQPVA